MRRDVVHLVARDHAELDRIVVAMADPDASPTMCVDLLEALRLGFTAHASAEDVVLRRLQRRMPALGPAASRIVAEHHDQAHAVAALAAMSPAGAAWQARVLELRVTMLEHAWREVYLGEAPYDDIPVVARAVLARGYATDRLRGLAVVEALVHGANVLGAGARAQAARTPGAPDGSLV